MPDVPPAPEPIPQTSFIRRLEIHRFRGIESLLWSPAAGVNVILGGGDTGKTTILEAIALLLSPTNATVLSDADYFLRNTDAEFSIEAAVSLADAVGINNDSRAVWPWDWDGKEPVQPNLDRPPGTKGDGVYRFRVRGTQDFELVWEILHPDGNASPLSVAVRRRIGLVRLGADERNDRDLRLVHGSALDRLVADPALRTRLAQKLAKNEVGDVLSETAQSRLTTLDEAFRARALPTDLRLGMTGSPGQSVNALIGLTAARSEARLPLATWGAGTRRLAALEIAATHQGDEPIVVIDEIERGLEPYRQRILVTRIATQRSQVFLTTHSPSVIDAAQTAKLWYLDARGSIGCLNPKTTDHRRVNPDAYLARLPIIVEGVTEVGFVAALLKRYVAADLLQEGIVVADGCGNDTALTLLDALSSAGLAVAGFVDEEGRKAEAWSRVKGRLGGLLFRWNTGCTEANIVTGVSDEDLERFITPPGGGAGDRLRTLAVRLGLQEKDFATIRAKAPDIRRLVIEAASGTIPESASDLPKDDKRAWKSHGQKWFKSFEGGQELEEKVHSLGVWTILEPALSPFLDAVREFVSGAGVTNKS